MVFAGPALAVAIIVIRPEAPGNPGDPPLSVLVFLTFVCAMTAAAYLPWLGARERRLYEERAEFQRQLGELETGLR